MAERTTHSVLPMGGRDPHEEHRAATPLELLFDLTFVIGFGVAADELAHAIADHHATDGLIGFGFADVRGRRGRGSSTAGSPPRTTPTTGSSGCSPWSRWSAC